MSVTQLNRAQARLQSDGSVGDEPRIHAWTKDEYYKVAEVGLFDGKRVELVEGEVIEMSPMKEPHATAATLVEETLHGAIGSGFYMRVQKPFNVGEITEPEPDVAIIRGGIRECLQGHPTTAALIVEVADTSLEYDRNEKSSLYARAGVPEYWILNLNERQLEVYREPGSDPRQPHGFGYESKEVVPEGGSASPLATPKAVITVSDLLP